MIDWFDAWMGVAGACDDLMADAYPKHWNSDDCPNVRLAFANPIVVAVTLLSRDEYYAMNTELSGGFVDKVPKHSDSRIVWRRR